MENGSESGNENLGTLICIVFRARSKPHLDNCTAKARKIQKRPVGVKENNWSQDRATKKSSYKEHRVDALAPYAEEGRGKLRKATGSGKQAMIR